MQETLAILLAANVKLDALSVSCLLLLQIPIWMGVRFIFCGQSVELSVQLMPLLSGRHVASSTCATAPSCSSTTLKWALRFGTAKRMILQYSRLGQQDQQLSQNPLDTPDQKIVGDLGRLRPHPVPREGSTCGVKTAAIFSSTGARAHACATPASCAI